MIVTRTQLQCIFAHRILFFINKENRIVIEFTMIEAEAATGGLL